MNGKIKKAVARKPQKHVETIQDLKNATDKYFAMREVTFDLMEVARIVIPIVNRYIPYPLVDANFDANLDETFKEWSDGTTKTRAELDIELFKNLDNMEHLVRQLARLKYETQREVTNA